MRQSGVYDLFIRFGRIFISVASEGRLSISLRLWVSMLVLNWLWSSISSLTFSSGIFLELDSGLIAAELCYDSDFY